jgi:hypothetical protein
LLLVMSCGPGETVLNSWRQLLGTRATSLFI